MGIKEKVDALLKEATDSGDSGARNRIRLMKSRVVDRLAAKGRAAGSDTDADWAETLSVQRRVSEKVLELETRRGAAKGEKADLHRREIELCDSLLPPRKSVVEVKALIEAKMASPDCPATMDAIVAEVVAEGLGSVDISTANRVADEIVG